MFFCDELTSPERALWDALPAGRRVDLRPDTPGEDQVADGGQWGPERMVRAAVVCALLLGANSAQPGAVAQLRLTGARIRGHLDLAGAQIAHPLWLETCAVRRPRAAMGNPQPTSRWPLRTGGP
ncbi:hypothetical protein [Streptomyces chartreusis]|uniref:hypothetical protein n=1 Tax=Streptomyces chartreusis TaxID=1969 RepID=UPI0036674792